MNISELHIAFKVEADKNAVNIGMSGCPSFLPEEIDYWLNTAYLSKIATKFTGDNTIRTPFEGNVKRVADLEKLVKTDTDLELTSETISNRLTLKGFTSSVTYGSTKQEKRMYFLEGVLNFDGKLTIVKPITHTQATKFLQTYNNKPWIEEPVATLEGDNLIIYYDTRILGEPPKDGSSKIKLDLTYVAYPRKLNNEDTTTGMDEIPEYMQYEVVKLAADMALENIESPRSQTHPQHVAQYTE
jgi:hypothetical protein